MKIHPLRDRVIVKRIEEEEEIQRGIIIPDGAKEKPQEGEILAIGPGKRLKNGKLIALAVKVGDRVLFGKYAGNELMVEGEGRLIMREDEILRVVEGWLRPPPQCLVGLRPQFTSHLLVLSGADARLTAYLRHPIPMFGLPETRRVHSCLKG